MDHLGLSGVRSYKMDLMVVNEAKLRPTWLYRPTLTPRLDEVFVDIRTIGAAKGFSA